MTSSLHAWTDSFLASFLLLEPVCRSHPSSDVSCLDWKDDNMIISLFLLFLGLGSFLAGVTVVRRRLAPPVPTVPSSHSSLLCDPS